MATTALCYPLSLKRQVSDKDTDIVMCKFNAKFPEYRGDIGGTLEDSRKHYSTSMDVYLPLPLGFGVSDVLQYETANFSGIANEVANRFLSNNTEVGQGDVLSILRRAGISSLDQINRILPVNMPASDWVNKEFGLVENPREYTLFHSPKLRTFNFSFKFLPKNEEENKEVEHIIKFFRYNSYPTVTASRIDFVAPPHFKIDFINDDESMIQIPGPVVLENITTTFNPTTTALVRKGPDGKRKPVEYELSLSFREVEPIYHGRKNEGSGDEIDTYDRLFWGTNLTHEEINEIINSKHSGWA
jgi:hypothetical protein